MSQSIIYEVTTETAPEIEEDFLAWRHRTIADVLRTVPGFHDATLEREENTESPNHRWCLRFVVSSREALTSYLNGFAKTIREELSRFGDKVKMTWRILEPSLIPTLKDVAKVGLRFLECRACADAIRLILEDMGVSYTMEYQSLDTCETDKHSPCSGAFRSLPVLTWNDTSISQPQAISLFLARKFHLTGSTDLEFALSVSILTSAYSDILTPLFDMFCASGDALIELGKKFVATARTALEAFERFLSANAPSKYFVGNSPCVGAYSVYYALEVMSHVFGDIISKCPFLTSFFNEMKKRERISNYRSSNRCPASWTGSPSEQQTIDTLRPLWK